jgi:predicted RecB family nuclease
MGGKITREVLESYLHCKTKAHLKLAGQQGTVSDYEVLLLARRQEVRQQAVAKILAKYPEAEVARGIPLTLAALQSGPPFALDAILEDDLVSLRFDGLKRVDGPSKLGDLHYIPMLFHEGRRVGKEQRLLLELYGLLLSEVQGRLPAQGVVWSGRDCKSTRVRLGSDLRRAERLLIEVRDLAALGLPPRLILNDHCQVCEFRQPCYAQAVQEDSISLLRGIGEKEIKRYARKGIFTVTQLAHVFRPRRKSKRQVQKTHRHYHALQALAVRDRRIYVFGTPELPSSPVRIYLDLEGNPEEGYVYLIGMIVVRGDSETRHSFWADGKEEEGRIFEEFLAEVGKYEDFVVFCYGGYERAFLKRMRKRAKRKAAVDRVLRALVNTLSLIYSYIYFPTYTNGLKDVGVCLGCLWTDPDASGIQSVVWRTRWEETKGEEWMQRLTKYNLEDCAALKKVVEASYSIMQTIKQRLQSAEPPVSGASSDLSVSSVEDLDIRTTGRWGKTNYLNPDFNYINRFAYSDYQRNKVYVRSSKVLKRNSSKKHDRPNLKLRINKRIEVASSKCSVCKSDDLTLVKRRNQRKRALDLSFTPGGIRRTVIQCRTSVYKCNCCGNTFIPERYMRLDIHFHNLKSWAMFLHVACRISLRTVRFIFIELFGVHISIDELLTIKKLMANFYKFTYNKIINNIISSNLAHCDETGVMIRRIGKGCVWVFANLEDVVFMYKPSREGEFLKDLFKNFNGVLVSDFYAAYESIDCPQQKCLIHLMRDMGDDLLNNPFDEELQSITSAFGSLLRGIVETIDRHGL